MNNGIKKWVTEYEGGYWYCNTCKRDFCPSEYKVLYKFGPNLAIWSVHQSISHKIGLDGIRSILQESFNILISQTGLLKLKSAIARKYRHTYKEIMQNLIQGPIIHTDETKVKVRKLPQGYVWVFTNMSSVLFLFRPNREADFLKGFFRKFKGVVISDFFSGYDSISCSQQKCLVHLIRDLNDDLFENQLNKELVTITSSFATLLQKIIETVDKYGLKKRHLNKHRKDVDSFYKNIVDADYETGIAQKIQKRFVKYESSLFCFLNHDGIPWNNNFAENTIKSFAKYRKNVDGSFTVKSIHQYLILLSIHQTCKYRGFSFLEFLKSSETSIDKYSKMEA